MNIETTLLPQLSQNVIDYLKEKSYSVKTLSNYRVFYRNFILYLEGKGWADFNKEKAFVFIDEHYERTKSISRNYRNSLERYVHVLFEFYFEGTVNTKRFAKHLVENAFLKLKRFRAVSTRYAKTTSAFRRAVIWASISQWIKLVWAPSTLN